MVKTLNIPCRNVLGDVLETHGDVDSSNKAV
jgi:hypothetical protein